MVVFTAGKGWIIGRLCSVSQEFLLEFQRNFPPVQRHTYRRKLQNVGGENCSSLDLRHWHSQLWCSFPTFWVRSQFFCISAKKFNN